MYPDLSGMALVFDYMPHTLYSKLKDDENPLSRQQIQSYTKMLLRGLSYLHNEMKIMHRVSRGKNNFGKTLNFIFKGHQTGKSFNQ